MQTKKLAPFLAASLAAACGIVAIERQPKPVNAAPRPPTLASSTPPAGSATAAPTTSASAAPIAPPVFVPNGTPGRFNDDLDVTTFQRGNIHTHTKWSDGDTAPETVVRWYRDHGYNFLAITDHNSRTNPELFRPLERAGFVLIPGEEVTMTAQKKPVHMNALCSKSTIGGGKFATAADALAWGNAQIAAQKAVGLVNHPNFDWALSKDDVVSVRAPQLLEIWSGHPWVHTEGDATRPSTEVIWDQVLTSGASFAGVAVDDSHHWKPNAPEPAARAGRGWIEVFAPKADKKAICGALAAGKLYASNGVKLKRITVHGASFSLTLDGAADVEFIGQGGASLQKGPTDRGAASYALVGGEQYVRARITGPDGKHAWTQAYRVSP